MVDLLARMRSRAEEVERVLADLLGANALEGETGRPARLLEAMRHAALGGGKRLRPFLLVEAGLACDPKADAKQLTLAGCALELVHCYSLVHDDLPAMDDDDMRRGRPTVHVAFDEATAILAGDALLTMAFDAMARAVPGERAGELVVMLARASGIGGMAGGQALDLEAETGDPGDDEIATLQAMKTGALLRFAAEAGAVAADASPAQRAALREYGARVGAAFQLADDILDVTQTAEVMGKATGKDAVAGKGTLVARHGVDWARRKLDELIDAADAALAPLGDSAGTLRDLARFVAQRDH